MFDLATIDKIRLKALLQAAAALQGSAAADAHAQEQRIAVRKALQQLLGGRSLATLALALLGDNERLEREAGRYRWLREGKGECVVLLPGEDLEDSEVLTGREADALIDALMEGKAGQG